MTPQEIVERLARADHETSRGMCRGSWEQASDEHQNWHRRHHLSIPMLLKAAGLRIVERAA